MNRASRIDRLNGVPPEGDDASQHGQGDEAASGCAEERFDHLGMVRSESDLPARALEDADEHSKQGIARRHALGRPCDTTSGQRQAGHVRDVECEQDQRSECSDSRAGFLTKRLSR